MDGDLTGALDKVLHLSALVSADLVRYERDSGLTVARVHLLWMLGMSGPQTQQSLASALEVSPRNVTGLVDGLVASGHVTREPHPGDRRAKVVTPTELGEQTIRGLRESHGALAERLFGQIPPDQLAAFTATVDQTITTFAVLMEDTR